MRYEGDPTKKELCDIAAESFMSMHTGDAILGRGISRTVIPYYPPCQDNDDEGTSPTFVLKICHTADVSANYYEYEVWRSVEMTKWSRWFAPIVDISIDGRVLIQHRTQPLATTPTKIPEFLTDLKIVNWGLLNGKPVCHDYATLNLMLTVGLSDKMINWSSRSHSG